MGIEIDRNIETRELLEELHTEMAAEEMWWNRHLSLELLHMASVFVLEDEVGNGVGFVSASCFSKATWEAFFKVHGKIEEFSLCRDERNEILRRYIAEYLAPRLLHDSRGPD